MAAIAVGSQSPTMGMVPDLARQVETTLPAGVTPDPEQILSYQPDMVLTTSRHGGEKDRQRATRRRGSADDHLRVGGFQHARGL